jgi:branched-subunit amino acid ABC-type transport system permease component
MLFIQILVNSSVTTMQVLLLSAALYLVYTVSGVFAVHLGALIITSAYLYYTFAILLAWPSILAWLAAILGSILFSVLIYFLLRPLIKEGSDQLSLLLSIALMLSIETVLEMVFGSSPQYLIPGVLDQVYFGAYRITEPGLWTLLSGTGLLAFLAIVLHSTPLGRKVRALNQHVPASESLHLNTQKVQITIYIFAGIIAAAVGILLGMNNAITPHGGTTLILSAFIALIVGGVKSYKGVVLATLLIILSSKLLTGLPLGSVNISTTWENAILFLLALLALLIKPQGLLSFQTRQS